MKKVIVSLMVVLSVMAMAAVASAEHGDIGGLVKTTEHGNIGTLPW
jgi:hypothetical protein